MGAGCAGKQEGNGPLDMRSTRPMILYEYTQVISVCWGAKPHKLIRGQFLRRQFGKFRSHRQFSFTLAIFFHIENFLSHWKFSFTLSNFQFCCPFLLPALAGQLARFCKSEISIHIGNFHSHRKFSFTLAIFFHIGNFHSHRKLFGTKKLTSGNPLGRSPSFYSCEHCHFNTCFPDIGPEPHAE